MISYDEILCKTTKLYKKFEIKNIISNFTGQNENVKKLIRYGNQKVRKGKFGEQKTPFY